MATATQFLAACVAELGVKESPPNSNCQPYSHELGRPCEAWCADFLVAIARRLELRLPSESAYTPTMANGFKQAGRWSTVPQVGAFAFWDFPNDGDSGIQHVSVVESWTATDVTTIDGNSSVYGSQSNGGQVVRRTRTRDWVVGYGLPAYQPTMIILEGDEVKVRVAVDFPGGKFDDKGRAWVQTDVPWTAFRNVIVNGRAPAVDGWDANNIIWAAQQRDGNTLITIKGGVAGTTIPVVWVDRT